MSSWYVRPAGGSYGAENGTSFENAWDGFGNVTWGGGGVVAGDTLYVYGTHFEPVVIGASGSVVNPVTMEFADGALIFPVVTLTGWTQVNTSEVYKKSTGAYRYKVWEDGVLLNPEAHAADSEATIEAALDRGDYTMKTTGLVVYVRCSDGAAPSTHTMLATDRSIDASLATIDTNGQSYLRIVNPRVRGANWNQSTSGGMIIDSGTDVQVVGGAMWECKFGVNVRGGTGVSINGVVFRDMDSSAVAVDASLATLTDFTVKNSYFSRIARVARYNGMDKQFNQDGDGIGIGHSGGTLNNIVIQDNYFQYTGPQYDLDADIPADVTNSPDVNRGAGIYVGTVSAMDVNGITVERNVFEDGHRYGLYLGDEIEDSVRVVGNVFLRTGNAPEYGLAAMQANATIGVSASFEISNNTFVSNVQRDSLVLANMGTADTLANRNNAFQDNDESTDLAAVTWRGDVFRTNFGTPAGDTESNNLHDTRTDRESDVLYREGLTPYNSISAYQTATSRGDNSLNEETFLRADGRPNGTSPGVAVGTEWWTGEPPHGADGMRFCIPPSMGAYEYYGGGGAGAIPSRVKPAGVDLAKARAA